MRVDEFIGYITVLDREIEHIIRWLKSRTLSLLKLTYP